MLATVSATNCGEGGAAPGHVELVIHARVVRRLGPRQHKVLQVKSANQMWGRSSFFEASIPGRPASFCSLATVHARVCLVQRDCLCRCIWVNRLQRRKESLFAGPIQLTVQACVGSTNGGKRGASRHDELVEVALVVGRLGLGQHHVVYV